MIDLDTVRLRARANLAGKRAHDLVRACSAITNPTEADDVAWGIRQVARLARELQADADAMAPLYEGAHS